MKIKNQYLITNCVDKYSVDQDNWKRVCPLPLQLACHAVVTVNKKLYVIGGWTPQVKKFLAYLPGVSGFAEKMWQLLSTKRLWLTFWQNAFFHHII